MDQLFDKVLFFNVSIMRFSVPRLWDSYMCVSILILKSFISEGKNENMFILACLPFGVYDAQMKIQHK